MKRSLLTAVLPAILLTLGLFAFPSCSTSSHHGGGTGPGNPTQPSAQFQYQVSLFNAPNENQMFGTVGVDAGGTITAQVQGATANTTFALQFCPAPSQTYTCLSPVGNVTTDGSGNATATMPFGASGSWAGDFHLVLNGTVQYQTDVVPNMNSAVYVAALQPGTTVNGKGIFQGASPGPQDSLTSGSLTVTGKNVQVQLTGASPNATYSVNECPLTFSSSCFVLSNSGGTQSGFMTDSNGNVTFTVLQDGVPGDIFQVGQASGFAGFAAGFKVP